MDHITEFYNKGLNARYNGYQLGRIHGICWGLIVGIPISLLLVFGWGAGKSDGKVEHTMLLFSSGLLLLTSFWGNPSSASTLQSTQEHFGTSQLYNQGYESSCFKWLFVGIAVTLGVSSYLSFYYVILKPWGYVLLISICTAIIAIAFIIFLKSPSKSY